VDLVCFSHLRWDFVFQRPQHLMNRGALERRVLYVEEPVFGEGPPALDISPRAGGVQVVVPRLPRGTHEREAERMQASLVDELLTVQSISDMVAWYYTPMALGFTDHLEPCVTVYDCMDELSAFLDAPKLLREREEQLMARADLVFTGGQSLYEAKRTRHPRVYAFPSSVDVAHFRQARDPQPDPPDQMAIPHPRLGFYGVIDERFDIELVRRVAELRPDWQIVLIGPVAKIDPATLPRPSNIHYLGGKQYSDLPSYLAGWDVALLTFALNASTRFISPTKTPEYLAAGRPVVSTPIRDVVRPYGERGFVRIAETPEAFVDAIVAALGDRIDERGAEIDRYLATMSWDRTWADMWRHVKSMNTPAEATAADPQGEIYAAGAEGPADTQAIITR